MSASNFIRRVVKAEILEQGLTPGGGGGGGGLSVEDQLKLDGIADGAEVNVLVDWDATSGDAQILNKPLLGTAAAEDTGAFATAAQGAKADTALQSVANATTATAGLMTPAYVNKVDGIASNATANATDATLIARENHTGTQTASTISDFNAEADARIALQKAVASGLATLDGTGKLTTAQIPAALLSGLKWQGVWDVAGDTPTIPAAATANNGFLYRVSVAGTSSITGASVTYAVGDWLISNGTAWQRVANTLPPASTTNQGAVQLVGDLAGTAGAPLVAKINGVAVPIDAPVAGQVWVATSDTESSWETLGAAASPATVAPPAEIAAAVGVSAKYAREDHAHDIDFYIGPSAPAKSGPLLWVQTGMGGGSDFTFWIQD